MNDLYFVVQNTHNGPEGLRVEFNAVPEPSSLALCGIAGIVGLAAARGRRKRAA